MRRLAFFLSILFLIIFPVYGLFAKPLVITTTEDLSSIAREIAGDVLEVEHIASGKMNTHHVEVKPSYALKLRRADVLIRNGLALDDWIFPLIDNSRNRKIRKGMPGHIDASNGVRVLQDYPGDVDRSMGHVHPEGNPHYLLYPQNGLIVAENLAAQFSTLYPKEADTFAEKLNNFKAKYSQKMEEWKPYIETVRGKQIVTYHKLWGYFTYFLDLEVPTEIEPKPGVPPTPSHTRYVESLIRDNDIRVIVRAPWYEERTPSAIAEVTGARVVTLAGQVGSLEGTDDFFALFDYNLEQLAEAFR